MKEKQIVMSYKEHEEWLKKFKHQEDIISEQRENFVSLKSDYDNILKKKNVVYLREHGDAVMIGRERAAERWSYKVTWNNIFFRFPVLVGMVDLVDDMNKGMRSAADKLVEMKLKLDGVNRENAFKEDKLNAKIELLRNEIDKLPKRFRNRFSNIK